MPKTVAPAKASPAALVSLFNSQGTQSVRLALACFKRWGDLVESRNSADEHLMELIKADGPKAMVAALEAHGEKEANVAEHGCRSLASIAYGSQDNKKLVVESGALPAILNAMQAHAAIPAVQVQGLTALANIAAGNDACKSALNSASAPTSVSSAIIDHKGDANLLLQAGTL